MRKMPDYHLEPRPFTPIEDKMILRMSREGWAASLVADELARSRSSILGRAFRLRVKFNGRSTGHLFMARWA